MFNRPSMLVGLVFPTLLQGMVVFRTCFLFLGMENSLPKCSNIYRYFVVFSWRLTYFIFHFFHAGCRDEEAVCHMLPPAGQVLVERGFAGIYHLSKSMDLTQKCPTHSLKGNNVAAGFQSFRFDSVNQLISVCRQFIG